MTDHQYTDAPKPGNPKGSWFKAWGDKGWGRHMVPLANGGKAPRSEFGWQDKVYTEQELSKADGLGRNLGIATGRRGQREYSLIAIDIEATKHADNIVEKVLAHFGDETILPIRHRAGSSSSGFFVKVIDLIDGAPEIRKRVIKDGKTKLVEVLAEGQQFHVGGARDDVEGRPVLEWIPDVPYLDDVPEMERNEFEEFLQDLSNVVPGAVLTGGPNPATTGNTTGETIPLDEIRKLVALIPNDHRFDDRDAWVRMGHAIWGASEGSPEARELWLEWSDTRPQTPGEPERVWDTIREAHAGGDTLRQMAKERSPNDYARSLFEDDLEEHAKQDPLNPGTGRPSYLAREVMGEAILTEAAVAATQTLETPFSYLSASKSLKRDAPIVEGWVYRDVVHTVVAAPGVGKSFLGLMIGWAAVLGREPRTGKATSPSHAYVLMGEDAPSEVAARSRACVEHQFKLDPDDISLIDKAGTRLHIRAGTHLPLLELDQKKQALVPKITPGLRSLCDWLEMIISLRDGKPVTLVLDMMRHAYVGDDNVRWQIDALFRVVRSVMSRLAAHGVPCGVVLTHHKTKATSRSGDATFSAAGSIGIEGNSRVVSHVGTRGDDFLEITRVKTNYGRTGSREFFRKVVVPSPLGGDTVWLEPVDEQTVANAAAHAGTRIAQLSAWVEAVHRWAVANPMTHIDAGTRGPASKKAGVTRILDVLNGTPEGVSCDKKDAEDVVQFGEQEGAWKVVRLRRQGVDLASGLEVDTNWVSQTETPRDGDETPRDAD